MGNDGYTGVFTLYTGFHPQPPLSIDHTVSFRMRNLTIDQTKRCIRKRCKSYTDSPPALPLRYDEFSPKRCGRNAKIVDFSHLFHSADGLCRITNRRAAGESAYGFASLSYTSLCASAADDGRLREQEGR